MSTEDLDKLRDVRGRQNLHWEKTFARDPEMFGRDPSYAAGEAARLFQQEGRTNILELGGGLGRDTLFFAREGFKVTVLDYSEQGVGVIKERAQAMGLAGSVTALRHDVRQPLPFADQFFEACYSHMLWCMAFTTAELEFLSAEVNRVLVNGGLNVYSVRNMEDPYYGKGIHRGEDMYEVQGGFMVHFFSREKVEHLAKGFDVLSIDSFEEGQGPKRLFLVTLRKDKRNEL